MSKIDKDCEEAKKGVDQLAQLFTWLGYFGWVTFAAWLVIITLLYVPLGRLTHYGLVMLAATAFVIVGDWLATRRES